MKYFLGFLTFLICNFNVYANDSRNYVLMPTGTDITELRTIYNEITTPLDQNSITYNETSWLKHTHYFDIKGNLAAIYLVVPYADIKQNNIKSLTKSGFIDPVILFAWGVYNMPALNPEQYIKRDKKTTTAACSIALTVPWGSYNSNNALNVGGNRYVEKGECQTGTYIKNVFVEAIGGVTHYGNNKAYVGKNILKQGNLYHFETHSSYNLSPVSYVGIDTYNLHGGQVYLNNKNMNKKQHSFSLGGTFAYLYNRQHFFRLMYQKTLHSEDYSPNLKTIALSYSYIW